ncbi:hypothetical protein [Pseudogemmobacter sonorensis]|uniref:hypothetical protein n=1 Tax=Pseudogemmobacter sonorensis TaxID=2989681 RepID=UPI0036A3712B
MTKIRAAASFLVTGLGAGALGLAVLAAAHPSALHAEEAVQGLTVSGGVRWGFGEEVLDYYTVSYVYDTVRVGSATVAPAATGMALIPGMDSLILTGTERPDGGGANLHIVLDFDGSPVDGETGAAEVLYYPDISGPPYWVSGAAGVSQPALSFSRYEFDGEKGHVAGRFSAVLCAVSEWEGEPDGADCREVEGAFETEIFLAL